MCVCALQLRTGCACQIVCTSNGVFICDDVSVQRVNKYTYLPEQGASSSTLSHKTGRDAIGGCCWSVSAASDEEIAVCCDEGGWCMCGALCAVGVLGD